MAIAGVFVFVSVSVNVSRLGLLFQVEATYGALGFSFARHRRLMARAFCLPPYAQRGRDQFDLWASLNRRPPDSSTILGLTCLDLCENYRL